MNTQNRTRFRANPRPDDDVIKLFAKASESARTGRVRTAMVVVVDGLNRSEHEFCGDLSEEKINALIGALTRAKHKLVTLK